MRISTLLRYLIGDREAIQEIAGDRRALGLGLLFVLSAGLARDYDGEDLLHEPWHLLLPLGASLVASFLLFTFVYRLAYLNGAPVPAFFSAYCSFLGLFWMTAPLAWLYAIPYERFLPPAEAAEANLLTLGVVALWRVALMIRVLHVVWNYHPLLATCLVMTVADSLVLCSLCLLPVPLLDIMGGIRLSEGDQTLRAAACLTWQFGLLSLPFWFIAAIAGAAHSSPVWREPPNMLTKRSPINASLWLLAVASVAVWGILLPFTQPEQKLRYRVEEAVAEGRIAAAVAEMSAHTPKDFPPHWNPPPRYFGSDSNQNRQLLDILDEIIATDTSSWIRSIYLGKLKDLMYSRSLYGHETRVKELLDRMPEGPALLEQLEREGHKELADQLRPNRENPAPGEERRSSGKGARSDP